MNFIRNVRSYLSSGFPKGQNNMDKAIGLVDVYFERILLVLSWKDAYTLASLIFCIGFHALLLLTDLNSYGCFFLTFMTLFSIDFLYRDFFIAEYTGQYSDNLRQLKGSFHNFFYNLRNDSPILFYPPITCFFWTLFVISKTIPGLLLSLCFFLVLFLLPLGFQWLPEIISEKITDFLKSLETSNTALAEDELLPYLQDFNKRDTDLDSLATDRTADSVTNSLASGISSMPSYLEVAEDSIGIQEEDLMPHPTKSFTPSELSSDSESETKGIKFDAEHFNTSSSEDDSDNANLVLPTTSVANSTEVIKEAGMLRNIMANIYQSAFPSKAVLAEGSESDNDFEVIDSDEIASLIKED